MCLLAVKIRYRNYVSARLIYEDHRRICRYQHRFCHGQPRRPGAGSRERPMESLRSYVPRSMPRMPGIRQNAGTNAPVSYLIDYNYLSKYQISRSLANFSNKVLVPAASKRTVTFVSVAVCSNAVTVPIPNRSCATRAPTVKSPAESNGLPSGIAAGRASIFLKPAGAEFPTADTGAAVFRW